MLLCLSIFTLSFSMGELSCTLFITNAVLFLVTSVTVHNLYHPASEWTKFNKHFSDYYIALDNKISNEKYKYGCWLSM